MASHWRLAENHSIKDYSMTATTVKLALSVSVIEHVELYLRRLFCLLGNQVCKRTSNYQQNCCSLRCHGKAWQSLYTRQYLHTVDHLQQSRVNTYKYNFPLCFDKKRVDYKDWHRADIRSHLDTFLHFQ